MLLQLYYKYAPSVKSASYIRLPRNKVLLHLAVSLSECVQETTLEDPDTHLQHIKAGRRPIFKKFRIFLVPCVYPFFLPRYV